ncbi:MAG TPA: winged helix-turn-helix domain-containing protein [Vicinamibacterales bacterium]|nr:winged helix-turn-helix domain-containing protein [Vicinamibacterales bacterium]
MGEPSRPSYEFGPFVVDAGKRILLRSGEPVPLTSKVFETLLALIENRERVLTKDELLKRVWRDTSVEEGGLTRNVSILRKTLGEKPDDHQYIVTIPARGYQFVAKVRERAAIDEAPRANPSAAPDEDSRPRGIVRAGRALMGGLAVLTLGTLVYVGRPVRATHPGPPIIRSLAVLPLQNLSGDPAQDYFADGVTEALISNLARIRALRVVSRTSVMRFKGDQRSLSEISTALNVDAVLEGSVQRTGDRVKISIQLIYAPTDTHLWAREYERELTDVLKLEGEVAHGVADEIRIQVTPEERARLTSATFRPAGRSRADDRAPFRQKGIRASSSRRCSIRGARRQGPGVQVALRDSMRRRVQLRSGRSFVGRAPFGLTLEGTSQAHEPSCGRSSERRRVTLGASRCQRRGRDNDPRGGLTSALAHAVSA